MEEEETEQKYQCIVCGEWMTETTGDNTGEPEGDGVVCSHLLQKRCRRPFWEESPPYGKRMEPYENRRLH